MKRAASDIIEIGQKLIEVKARLPYGTWTDWLTCEFGWTDQTARNFMHVAQAFAGQNQKIFDFAPSALYILAAPSVPDEARREALDRAEAGEPLDRIRTAGDASGLFAPGVAAGGGGLLATRPALGIGARCTTEGFGWTWGCGDFDQQIRKICVFESLRPAGTARRAWGLARQPMRVRVRDAR